MNQENNNQEYSLTDEIEEVVVADDADESSEDRNIYIEFFRH